MFLRKSDKLINLSDKDILITEDPFRVGERVDGRYYVVARGPESAASNDGYLDTAQATFILCSGTENSCQWYLDDLHEHLDGYESGVIDAREFSVFESESSNPQ